MDPKEKAEQLIEKFLQEVRGGDRYNYNLEDMNFFIAKQCALIAVEEILNNFGTLTEGKQHYAAYCTIKFYQEVKQEIEKI